MTPAASATSDPRLTPRLVLFADAVDDLGLLAPVCVAADVAAAVIDGGHRTGAKAIAAITSDLQAIGVAVMITGEARDANRAGADGIWVEDATDIRPARRGNLMVGAGPVATRHEAMLYGEQEPDVLLLTGDGPGNNRTSAPPDFAAWWQELFQIPGIAFAATRDDMRDLIAASLEFVGVDARVWAAPDAAAALAETLPRMETVA